MEDKEINRLILEYTQGKRSNGDLIFAALRPRLTRLAQTYASRTGVPYEDLESAAYHGFSEGLNKVNPEIGSSLEFLCRSAQWAVGDALRTSYLINKKHSQVCIGDMTLNDNYSSNQIKHKNPTNSSFIKHLKSVVEAASTTDEYPSDSPLSNLPLSQKDADTIALYLKHGTYEKAAQAVGVSKQAINARIKRITQKLQACYE